MDKGIKNLTIYVSMKGIMWMVNLKELVNIHGKMGNFMKVNGSMGWRKDQECGEGQKVTHILANGNKGKQMGMEYIRGLMGIDMKDSSKSTWNMVKGFRSFRMVIFTKETM
jgi:hypothetical protein